MNKKTNLSIGCRCWSDDKERITRLFKKHNISVAGYTLTQLLKKVNELEEQE